jgi:L-rhamnose isomerase
VAATPEARERGLSGRDASPEGGMVFVFPEPRTVAFWMRDVAFDLDIAFMIDQSHNLEPKVQATIVTVCRVQETFAKALCVDRRGLAEAQRREDTLAAEGVLRAAFGADVTPLLAQVRRELGVPAEPLAAFRASGYEQAAARDRAGRRKVLGISRAGTYA